MYRCVNVHAVDEKMIKKMKNVIDLLHQRTTPDVDVVLLGFKAVWTGRQIRTFRRNIMSPSSGLKISHYSGNLPERLKYHDKFQVSGIDQDLNRYFSMN
jgi:hypothetical protein